MNGKRGDTGILPDDDPSIWANGYAVETLRTSLGYAFDRA